MNFSYGAPPSASTGALKSLQPDFPEKSQPKVAVAYATEPPPPTYSTGMINTSDSQFPAVGQRALQTYESFLQPPQETAVRTLQNSNNQLSNRGWDDAYGGGGNISDLVHKNYSSTSAVDDPYNGGGAPGISDYARRDRSYNGSSTDDFNSLPNASHSMTGNRFKQAYKQFNQFDS